MDTVAYTTTPDQSLGIIGIIMGFFGFFMIFILAIAILMIVCMWRIFVKAGQPGWAAIIPIYNVYILLKVINKPAWWLIGLLLGIIPVVGSFLVIAFEIVIALELGRKFDKSTAFSIFAIALFPFVGYPMLAFGNAEYNATAAPVTTFMSGNESSVPTATAEPVTAPQQAPASEPAAPADTQNQTPENPPQA